MQYKDTKYYRIGRASDLAGTDYYIYRALEIIPGFLTWLTIFGIFIGAIFFPFYCAVFIILFDLYWLLKTVYLSIYLRKCWQKMKANLNTNWEERLQNFKISHIYHLVILPFYNEEEIIIEKSLESIIKAKWNKKKIILLLATEARAGEKAKVVAESIQKKYADRFGYFLVTTHPFNLPEEMPGKGSNIAYAIEQARVEILDKNEIAYKNVLVSTFDVDTVVYQHYFSCLTWNFLVSERPYRTSFQPVPLFNNNIWEAPSFSRVVAYSGTFWQMIQQERPEKLSTFSSHAVCFKTLLDVGYWQKNIVSEDSRIFWSSFLAYDGDYVVTPMYYPVAMDGNLAPTYLRTMINVYKQQRRWAWGAENFCFVAFGFIKNKNISIFKKISVLFTLIEGLWSWSTNSLIIFFLGWLPLWLGGREFSDSILSYNLPVLTRDLMTMAMSGMVFSIFVSNSFLPPKPNNINRWKKYAMVFQWLLIPVTILFFGAFPAIEAQTRLMFAHYMGFWVTPKHRGLNSK